MPDRLVGYLKCVEELGGNRLKLTTSDATSGSSGVRVEVEGKGSGVIISGSGKVDVGRTTVDSAIKKIDVSYGSGATETCLLAAGISRTRGSGGSPGKVRTAPGSSASATFFDVTLSQRNDDERRKAPSRLEVTYDYDRLGDKVRIRPNLPYLAAQRKGEPLVGGDDEIEWRYPELSIKVVNNTSRTLFFTEVAVDVVSSEVNTEPILFIAEDTLERLDIEDAGWGEMADCQLRFGIADVEAYKKVDRRSPLPYKKEIGTFQGSVSVPLKAFTDEFIEAQHRTQTEGAAKQGQLFHTLLVGERVTVYGELSYLAKGARRALRFKTRIWTGRQPYGAAMLSEEVVGLSLEAGKSGYTKRIPISRYAKPGDVDHFTLKVLTDKSSRNQLTVTLVSADGQSLPGRKIDLETLIPRLQGVHRFIPKDAANTGRPFSHKPLVVDQSELQSIPLPPPPSSAPISPGQ